MSEYPVQVTESLLQDITRRIVEGFEPDKIILFGSQATGTSRADSDIDLLIIMDSQLSALERAVAVKRACRPRFVSMDVLVKTPEEIEARLQQGNLFFRQILARGRVLYERQP